MDISKVRFVIADLKAELSNLKEDRQDLAEAFSLNKLVLVFLTDLEERWEDSQYYGEQWRKANDEQKRIMELAKKMDEEIKSLEHTILELEWAID